MKGFFLTSAGLNNSLLVQALLDLTGKPASEISFVFVPTAANLETDSKLWLEENINDFKKQNFKVFNVVDIATASPEEWKNLFSNADVICFGGGNEQYLAKICEDVGMKEFLLGLENKVYMGISAGSMVAGQFINNELMKVVYPEEVNQELALSLGLVDLRFIPHLNSEWFTHVRKETLEALKPQFESNVYACDDETALVIKDGNVKVVGEGDWWVSNK